MKNCKLVFCFLLLGAWACAEEGVVDVANAFESVDALNDDVQNIETTPPPCYTNSKTPVSCDGVGKDRLLPHPDDCRLFYQCAGILPLCQECPAGLHFNPELHVCDYPDDAGCQISSS